MSAILYRTAQLESGTGRQLYGRAVPYGEVAEIADYAGQYKEKFAYGSFARSIEQRGSKIRLLTGHDHRRLPVGRATELREQPDGLYASFEVAPTQAGDELLTLVRDGYVSAFSIGFTPIAERWEGDVLVRTEASLREVSVVNEPAYAGAAIQGVRSESLVIPRSIAEARLSLLDW
ncbi:HK97 family phage prohead protease [Mycobacterium kansasii]|uniref:HK97 family phage prohead protease n=1 Tax=Mycobacterium ostraviense TaxID=2738409 RepID=UPI0015D4B888|nr:HK97 family phage prohead protease [Mycobacterium ostraviense]